MQVIGRCALGQYVDVGFVPAVQSRGSFLRQPPVIGSNHYPRVQFLIQIKPLSYPTPFGLDIDPIPLLQPKPCSGFLGFTLGMLAIASSTDGIINVWSWLILFGIFVVDATTTLVTRILRRDRWFEAHRSHTYQILARRFNSHWKVSVGVLVINIVWLLPFAILATEYPYWLFRAIM